MAYTDLVHSTTADATDVNENFLHIGQGSRLPMGGSSLANTTGVYDLGSDANRWNDVFAQDIDLSGSITTLNQGLWQLVDEFTASVPAYEFVIFDINGDDSDVYKIISYVKSENSNTAAVIGLRFNNITTGYGVQQLTAFSTTVSASRSATTSEIPIGYVDNSTTTLLTFSETIIYTKTGNERTGLCSINGKAGSTYIGELHQVAFIWSDTTTTITSLHIHGRLGRMDIGTHFEIWRRK